MHDRVVILGDMICLETELKVENFEKLSLHSHYLFPFENGCSSGSPCFSLE